MKKSAAEFLGVKFSMTIQHYAVLRFPIGYSSPPTYYSVADDNTFRFFVRVFSEVNAGARVLHAGMFRALDNTHLDHILDTLQDFLKGAQEEDYLAPEELEQELINAMSAPYITLSTPTGTSLPSVRSSQTPSVSRSHPEHMIS